MSDFPDYYAILEIPATATEAQIKTAYKKASLKCHPDRVAAGPNLEQRRRKATIEFQKTADAYYILSDPVRRGNYDRQRASRSGTGYSTSSGASSSYFSSFFGGGGGTQTGEGVPDPEEDEAGDDIGGQPDPGYVFGNVFEEMLRPEVQNHVPLWTWLGAGAGATIGFIIGNIPGAAIGGYGGSRLGAVRDAKGKAVYQVFQDLGGAQKAEILRSLAMKVLGAASA